MLADLHCHSTASDGALTPHELVARAHEQGVDCLALTDHDTLAGLAEARATAETLGIQFIDGVEISCLWQGATIHVLGYAFERDAPDLHAALTQLQAGRWARAEEIGRRLAAKGLPGCFEGACQVQAARGDARNPPSRPHFAEFMVQAGYVRDHQQAFQRWLGAGKLGDIRHHWPTFAECMHTLHAARAWISLAHLCHYTTFSRGRKRQLVRDFATAGGHALEVSNGPQDDVQVGALATLAREFQLLASAGSDFHGPRPWSEVGRYRALPADLSSLEQVLRSGIRPPLPPTLEAV